MAAIRGGGPMSILAIDLGSETTRLAVQTTAGATPRLLELGRGAALPTLLYVPSSGPVRCGDEARQQILGDPNGAVRNFVHLLQRTEDVFRNGRWVNATDLTATFFHDLRDRIGRVLKGETLVAVVLPTKAVTEHGVRESLKRSAMLGGFTNVSTVDAPACIAQSATATQDLDAEAVVVADMGAGRTELCLVERKRGMFRVCPKVLAISAIGVAWIDDMVWDNLRKSPEEHPKTAGEADTVRRELAAARECFMGNGTGAGEATSPHALPVSPRVIERSLTQYYDEAFAGLPALVRETTGAGFANAPLVLAGEGSRLFGVESALRDRGWVGPILRFHPPGTMTVLGATLFAKTAKRTCPRCELFNEHWRTTCRGCGVPFSSPNPPAAEMPRPRSPSHQPETAEQVECPESDCRGMNPRFRTYCAHCGSLLPAAMTDEPADERGLPP